MGGGEQGDATVRHHPAAQKAVAYLGDLIHVLRRPRLWGAVLAGLAVLAEAGAPAVDAAIAFPMGKLDAPTSVSHIEKWTGPEGWRVVSWGGLWGSYGSGGRGGVLRSRAALRKVWWRRRGVRQLLSRRPCLGGGLYFAQKLEGPGSRAGMSSACSSSCGPVAAVQKGRAGAMLKSEGGRCGAAGVVARMEWSFTCTSAGQHSSWLLGGRWSLQIAPSATSVRQRSSGPVLPWRGLWRPGNSRGLKEVGGPFGGASLAWCLPRSAGFALALSELINSTSSPTPRADAASIVLV